ncbi:hypothetical protein ACM1ZW_00130 [Pseudomonas sp. NFX71]
MRVFAFEIHGFALQHTAPDLQEFVGNFDLDGRSSGKVDSHYRKR